jgi:hypothetical protein
MADILLKVGGKDEFTRTKAIIEQKSVIVKQRQRLKRWQMSAPRLRMVKRWKVLAKYTWF